MITAIHIRTPIWNATIQRMQEHGWKTTYRYDNFDAGIDFDLLILKKEGDEIIFGWDNWFEGEIRCTEAQLAVIEDMMRYKFETGEPNTLTAAVIKQYRSKYS